MLKKLLNHKTQAALTLAAVFALVLIRANESTLFYDPFLAYFRADYFNLPLPKVENLQLFFGLLFRYFLNTIVSLVLIYVLFKDIDAVKFAAILYIVFFVVLVAALFFILLHDGENYKMQLFYIRRFLIQPIFLLLFLPAFYYQKQKQ